MAKPLHTQLVEALQYRKLPKLKKVLETQSPDFELILISEKITPLMLAVSDNYEDGLKLLLKANAAINTVIGRNSALHIAVRKKNLKFCELLVQAGANPDLANKEGETPFDLALENLDKEDKLNEEINLNIVLSLFKNENIDHSIKILNFCQRTQRFPDKFNQILLDFNEILVASPQQVMAEDAHVASDENEFSEIDLSNVEQITDLLCRAVARNDAVVCEHFLLRCSPEFFTDGKSYADVLVLAIKKNHNHIVRLLLRHKPDLQTAICERIVQAAVAANNEEICAELIKLGAQLNFFVNSSNLSLLTFAMKSRVKESILEALLTAGAQPNLVGEAFSPLYSAAVRGRRKCCEILLKHGANKDEVNLDNRMTPFTAAIQRSAYQLLDLLYNPQNPDHVAAWKELALEKIMDNDQVIVPIFDRMGVTTQQLQIWITEAGVTEENFIAQHLQEKLRIAEFAVPPSASEFNFSDLERLDFLSDVFGQKIPDAELAEFDIPVPQISSMNAERVKKKAIVSKKVEEGITTFAAALDYAREQGDYRKVWELFDANNVQQQQALFSLLVIKDFLPFLSRLLAYPEVIVTDAMRKEAANKPEIARLVDAKYKQQTVLKEKAVAKHAAEQRKTSSLKSTIPVAASADTGEARSRRQHKKKNTTVPEAPNIEKWLTKVVNQLIGKSVDMAEKLREAQEEQLREAQRADQEKLDREELQLSSTLSEVMQYMIAEVEQNAVVTTANTSSVETAPQEQVIVADEVTAADSSEVMQQATPAIKVTLDMAAANGVLHSVLAFLGDENKFDENLRVMSAAFLNAGRNSDDSAATHEIRCALVRRGALVFYDQNGDQLLHFAVRNQNYPLMNLCFSYDNAAIHRENQDGYTPLDLAVNAENYQLCEYLLNNGAVAGEMHSEYFANKSREEYALGHLESATRAKYLQALFVQHEAHALSRALGASRQGHGRQMFFAAPTINVGVVPRLGRGIQNSM